MKVEFESNTVEYICDIGNNSFIHGHLSKEEAEKIINENGIVVSEVENYDIKSVKYHFKAKVISTPKKARKTDEI